MHQQVKERIFSFWNAGNQKLRKAEIIGAVRRNWWLCCEGQIRKQQPFCCSVSCQQFTKKAAETTDQSMHTWWGLAVTGWSMGMYTLQVRNAGKTHTQSCFAGPSSPHRRTPVHPSFWRTWSRVWRPTSDLSSAGLGTSTTTLFKGNAPQNLDQGVTVPCLGTRSSWGLCLCSSMTQVIIRSLKQ